MAVIIPAQLREPNHFRYAPTYPLVHRLRGHPAGHHHWRASGSRGLGANARRTVSTTEFFEARIRPLLISQCYECHAETANGGLRVDSRQALLTGGESGPAIVPGDPDQSLLIQAVKRLPNAPQMPSKRPKLRDEEIAGARGLGESRRAMAGR